MMSFCVWQMAYYEEKMFRGSLFGACKSDCDYNPYRPDNPDMILSNFYFIETAVVLLSLVVLMMMQKVTALVRGRAGDTGLLLLLTLPVIMVGCILGGDMMA